ncbi:MAG: phage tail protein [Methylococcaceae bacterium]|nr:phage tail protein [Methylococcaceae bacterium]
MNEPIIGEIRSFGFNFAPVGWASCDGRSLRIAENTALFSILGAAYGGDGTHTFALPNLQGNVAVGAGQGHGLTPRALGEMGGESGVTLTRATMPVHTHAANATNALGDQLSPAGNVWAADKGGSKEYSTKAPTDTMNPLSITPNGQNPPQSHDNRQPYLVLNYCIALTGIFPPRS